MRWRQGSTTFVAREGALVVGLVQIFGDGRIQALLSLVGVLSSHRRRGVAGSLIRDAFRRAGGKWLDLAAEPGSEEFYSWFVQKERTGFRIYPVERPVA